MSQMMNPMIGAVMGAKSTILVANMLPNGDLNHP
jgi:hypothetical protein